MSISIVHEADCPAPKVKHLDCDQQMEMITFFPSTVSIIFLFQCGKCKKVEAVIE